MHGDNVYRTTAAAIAVAAACLVAGCGRGEPPKDPTILDVTSADALDQHLAQLTPEVRTIDLSGNAQVTDEHLAKIKAFKSVTTLMLDDTAITDAGVAHLAQMDQLEYLSLSGTQITDASIDHLKELQNLDYVIVSQTGVTQKGAAKLAAAMPPSTSVDAGAAP